jgi:hypothetical protein
VRHHHLHPWQAPRMRFTLLLVSAVSSGPLRVHPGLRVSRAMTLPVRMAEDECVIPNGREERFAKLDATLKELQAAGIEEGLLAPLKRELAEFKLENVRLEMAELKTELSSAAAAAAATPPSPVPAPPLPAPSAPAPPAVLEQPRNPTYQPPARTVAGYDYEARKQRQSEGLLGVLFSTVFGPPRPLTAAERAARAEGKKRKVAMARAQIERAAAQRADAAMRTDAERASYEKVRAEGEAAAVARQHGRKCPLAPYGHPPLQRPTRSPCFGLPAGR